LSILVLGTAAIALSACGGGSEGDGGAAELAKQQELRAARAQAAQNARQSARIKALEHELKNANKPRVESTVAPAPSGAPPVEEAADSVATTEALSLEGLWKGEATISYDDGRSDPFEQTIQINSLVPGEVSGYSEAVQGKTTCHGPITLQGVSEGWYQFTADEQNKAECIDSSEVELLQVSPEVIEYRETTEVSFSSGTLRRVE
jgi:hypothetical protein